MTQQGESVKVGQVAAMPGDVRAAFDAIPEPLRLRFAELRARIYLVADEDARIGPLEESLKWGEPAYRPRSGAGSTIRLAVPRTAPDHCGVFFICSTGLVDDFRASFPELSCLGNRAVLVASDGSVPDVLDICLHRALSYHLPAS